MIIRFFVVLMVLLTGCSNDIVNIEIPTDIPQLPSYVSQMSVIEIQDSTDLLCILLTLEEFWEQGNNPDELNDHIVENSLIRLDDGQLYTYEDGLQFSTYDRLYTIFDSHHQVRGYYGGPIELCMVLENIPNGNHKLDFETSSQSGKLFQFTSYFAIDGEITNILSS